jgi:hypothetical protein
MLKRNAGLRRSTAFDLQPAVAAIEALCDLGGAAVLTCRTPPFGLTGFGFGAGLARGRGCFPRAFSAYLHGPEGSRVRAKSPRAGAGLWTFSARLTS